MPWGQTFIPAWTGSGLERVFTFREEQATITCTNDMRVIIQDVSSIGLQMIGGCMQINSYIIKDTIFERCFIILKE